MLVEHAHRTLGDFVVVYGDAAVLTGQNHTGLEDSSGQVHLESTHRLEKNVKGMRHGGFALLASVVTVENDFGLYNRYHVILLANAGVACQGKGVCANALVGWNTIANGDNCPPLGKTGASGGVGGHALG